MTQDLLKGGEGGNGEEGEDMNEEQLNKMMGDFTKMFGAMGGDKEGDKETAGNDIQNALNSVVNEIISKESLYEPMKQMKDEFPKWLENYWQSCSDDDLERYNK